MVWRSVRWIGEWVWVLYAFVRGRVFQEQKYRPTIAQYTDGVSVANVQFFMRATILSRLLRLWGYRMKPSTDPEELLKVADLYYLQRDGSSLSTVEMATPSKGGDNHVNRIIPVLNSQAPASLESVSVSS